MKKLFMYVALLAGVFPSLAFAQTEANIQEESSPWMQWVFVLVSAALVIAISTKNAKRTHQG